MQRCFFLAFYCYFIVISLFLGITTTLSGQQYDEAWGEYFATEKNDNALEIWAFVRDTILEVFAGPADTGVFSASVQNAQHNSITIYNLIDI